ncbi:hypothetical protein cand_037450 [Cryptosporidium andersoni]|uniref:Nop14-like family protein n=1 Tax=Cryptosporidium andersoni TaxID=117008 RepID=A0A1J4MUK0_9CRYT|nr:hypothetical protein cand_037450 [Cryptosporidium andersoni]
MIKQGSVFDQAKSCRTSHIKVLGKRKFKQDGLSSNIKENIERRSALLKELQAERKKSEFVDERERFNPSNNNRVLAGLLSKKISKIGNKKKSFNLEDNSENEEGIIEEDNGNLGLTHLGISLSLLSDHEISKFDMKDSDLDDEVEDPLHTKFASEFYFGKGESGATKNNEVPITRQDIFKEIILKSKVAKAEKRRHREELEERLKAYNESFSEIHPLLSFKPTKQALSSVVIEKLGDINFAQISQMDDNNKEDQIDDYDLLRSELVFDIRSGVSDRIKTKEEIAALNAKKLSKLEEERRQRMNMELMQDYFEESGNECGDSEIKSNEDEEKDDEDEEKDDEDEEKDDEDDEYSEDDNKEEYKECKHDISNKQEYDNYTNQEDVGPTLELAELFDEESQTNILIETLDIEPLELIIPDVCKCQNYLDEVENKNIDWLRNEENELELPYRFEPSSILGHDYSYKDLMKYLVEFHPISQWKLIHRFRACFNKGNPYMVNDAKLITKFLIFYPLNIAKKLKVEPSNVMSMSHIIEFLRLMCEHLFFFLEVSSEETIEILAIFSLEICCLTLPDITKLYKIEQLIENHLTCKQDEYYCPDALEWCPNLFYQLKDTRRTFDIIHVTMCRIMFLIFPITDLSHPILTPVTTCLELWAERYSRMGKVFTEPYRTSESINNLFIDKHAQVSLSESCDLRCITGIIALLEMACIGYTQKDRDLPEFEGKYSPGYFALSVSCVKWVHTRDKYRESIGVNILKSLIRVIKCMELNPGIYIPIIHFVLPNFKWMIEYSRKLQVTDCSTYDKLLSDVIILSEELATRPLSPVQLWPKLVPSIRMLTPKIDDPSVPNAVKALMRPRQNLRETQSDMEKRLYLSRVKKEVNSARRQANRQIRRDAEVIANIWHKERSTRQQKQNRRHNSFMQMLEHDQTEYKKMKTTGGTMDTSLAPYRSNKKAKKSNRRMGGNETASGLIQ